jgi:hypothetical protein
MLYVTFGKFSFVAPFPSLSVMVSPYLSFIYVYIYCCCVRECRARVGWCGWRSARLAYGGAQWRAVRLLPVLLGMLWHVSLLLRSPARFLHCSSGFTRFFDSLYVLISRVSVALHLLLFDCCWFLGFRILCGLATLSPLV